MPFYCRARCPSEHTLLSVPAARPSPDLLLGKKFFNELPSGTNTQTKGCPDDFCSEKLTFDFCFSSRRWAGLGCRCFCLPWCSSFTDNLLAARHGAFFPVHKNRSSKWQHQLNCMGLLGLFTAAAAFSAVEYPNRSLLFRDEAVYFRRFLAPLLLCAG